MKMFHSIMPSIKLGFDLICITLAGIYTFQQFYTYVQNGDYSEISFRKFTDDSTSENYPTYTICFEDQSQHHIYKTEVVKTTNPFTHSTKWKSDRCQCGCHVQKEGNRLLLLKQSCPDREQFPEFYQSDGSYDNPLPNLYDEHGNMNNLAGIGYISGQEHSFHQDHIPYPDYGHHSYETSFPSNHQDHSLDDVTNFNWTDNNFSSNHDSFSPYNSNVSAYESSYPVYDLNISSNETDPDTNDINFETYFPSVDYWESEESQDVDFDLNSEINHEMIVVTRRNKTYIVSPEQYKLLMLGFNQSFEYSYEDQSYNKTIQSISIAFDDVDFHNATIDFEDFLLDFDFDYN